MKKLIVIVLVLAAGASIYVYLHPRLRSGLESQTRRVVTGHHRTTTLYKWRNASGEWQLSDHPPPTGTPYETQRFRNDTNVVPGTAFTGQPTKH